MISFILILSILLWLGGYFMTTYKMSNTGLLSEALEKIITPPKWLYYLCGAPRPKDYPRGTMRVSAFKVQMLGIISVICICFSRIWKTSEIKSLMSLIVGVIFALMLTSYISKKYFVKDQMKNRKTKKRI